MMVSSDIAMKFKIVFACILCVLFVTYGDNLHINVLYYKVK